MKYTKQHLGTEHSPQQFLNAFTLQQVKVTLFLQISRIRANLPQRVHKAEKQQLHVCVCLCVCACVCVCACMCVCVTRV